jgi:cytochrome c biogenesis protein CcmG, thiol:disulfide interchange protein DsbE
MMETEDTQPDDQLRLEAQSEKIVPKRKGSRKRSITIFIVVSLLNVGLLALLWSQLLTPAQNQAGANSNGPTVADPLKGRPAPDFRLETLSATTAQQAVTLALATFKGKAVVLNFWSSSCGPCQAEAPLLQATWQRMQAKGVVFIGVDFQDARSDGSGFLQKYHITYPNVLDANGATAINYGVVYTPTTYFINSKGIVVSMIPRQMTAQELQKNVQLLTG